MSTAILHKLKTPCSCGGAAEVAVLNHRIAQLTEENAELKRDKQSFREAHGDARKHWLKLSNENKDLRERVRSQKAERKLGLGEVEKPPESEVRLSAAGMQGEANSDPDSSALGFLPSGLAASYPSPAESDGVIGGDGGQADDEDESTPRALWSREPANEYSPHPSDTPDTDLPRVPIPTSPLSASSDAAKSVATGPPPPTPSADRGLNLSDDVSDPRLPKKGKYGSQGATEVHFPAISSATTDPVAGKATTPLPLAAIDEGAHIGIAVAEFSAEGHANPRSSTFLPVLGGPAASDPPMAYSADVDTGGGSPDAQIEGLSVACTRVLGKRGLVDDDDDDLYPRKRVGTDRSEYLAPTSPLPISQNLKANVKREPSSPDLPTQNGVAVTDDVSSPRLWKGLRSASEVHLGVSPPLAPDPRASSTERSSPPPDVVTEEVPTDEDQNIDGGFPALLRRIGPERAEDLGGHFIGPFAARHWTEVEDDTNSAAYHLLPPTPQVPQQSPPKKGVRPRPMRHGTTTPAGRP